MTKQEIWRSMVMETNPLHGRNHSLSSRLIAREIEGDRRLGMSRVEERRQSRRDRRVLEQVRMALIDGIFGCDPRRISEGIDYLRGRGYSDFDMLNRPTPVNALGVRA
jgi:hypothetical protein